MTSAGFQAPLTKLLQDSKTALIRFNAVFESCNSFVKGAWNPAEVIVGFSTGAVDAYVDVVDFGFFNFSYVFFGEERAVGSQRNVESAVGGISRNLKEVFARERFSSRESQSRHVCIG